MPIANLIASDGHIVPKASPMGRQVAGEQFIRAFIRNSQNENFLFTCPSDVENRWISDQVATYRPQASCAHYPLSEWQVAAKKQIASTFPTQRLITGAGRAYLTETRAFHSWELFIHYSKAIQQAIGAYLTSPIRHWDALICTSKAARDVLSEFLERQKDWLKSKTDAKQFELPQLPIIPLGIDTSHWEPKFSKERSQKEARHLLGLSHDSIIVLMAGRLDILTKYKPEQPCDA